LASSVLASHSLEDEEEEEDELEEVEDEEDEEEEEEELDDRSPLDALGIFFKIYWLDFLCSGVISRSALMYRGSFHNSYCCCSAMDARSKFKPRTYLHLWQADAAFN